MSEVRQRNTGSKGGEKDTSSAPSVASRLKEEDRPRLTILEVLRTITLVLVLSGLVSWFVTRDNAFWGLKRPRATQLSYWKSMFAPQVILTDDELKAFDGSDPTKPLYLAVNGTIYDVSAGSRFYGPKGSYHYFGGADGSRAFVTTCFDSDIKPDMRGVEEMFMPKSTPQVDEQYTAEELMALKEEELIFAKEKAYKSLKHWVDFFENHPKYMKVGKVKREKGWETQGEAPKLCKNANNARPFRKPPVRST